MLIIFDCDGVLVDSEAIANRLLVKHLRRLKVQLSEADGQRLYRGLSMESILHKIRLQTEADIPKNFLSNLQKETFQELSKHLKPIQGVEECILWIKARRIPMCVASSGSYEKLSITLSATGLDSYFMPNIFSASDVEYGKPAPDLFLYAAQRMGVENSDCIVVEDSLPGVEAGVSAGMTVLAYAADQDAHFVEEAQKMGVLSFNTMSDLPSLLQKTLNNS